jgi:hypothetical protein
MVRRASLARRETDSHDNELAIGQSIDDVSERLSIAQGSVFPLLRVSSTNLRKRMLSRYAPITLRWTTHDKHCRQREDDSSRE